MQASAAAAARGSEAARPGWFAKYVLPGFILKAAIIGGGYVSGRELEQYFSSQGPLGGLLGMGIAMAIWSCVYAATLEFARVHHSYDYRTFFRNLLGPGWVVFEIAYLLMILTALSVFTSVAGNIFHNISGWPLLMCEVGFMTTVAATLRVGVSFTPVARLAGWRVMTICGCGPRPANTAISAAVSTRL